MVRTVKSIVGTCFLQWFVLLSIVALIPACDRTEQVDTVKNLIPDKPGTSPNYWCTWAVQNYMHGQGASEPDPILRRVEAIGKYCAINLNEETLFGEKGWASTFYPKIRGDLYVVVDDGWDLPKSGDQSYRNSSILWEDKFPSFHGTIPDKLTQFNSAFTSRGWRGVGFWYLSNPSQPPEEVERRKTFASEDEYNRAYYGERLDWSHKAGVSFWKVDGGNTNDRFRMLTAITAEHAPGLIMEYPAPGDCGPFNAYPGNGRASIKQAETAVVLLTIGDVVRLYDISPELGTSTMLDRMAQVFALAAKNPDSDGIVNVDDEIYLAATLGGVVGILRHNLIGLRPGGDPDVYMNGPRVLKRRMDEVTRGIRWMRLAPAFPANAVDVHLDDRVLFDSWTFEMGEFWSALEDYKTTFYNPGKTVLQGAPARVSRGLPLPEVSCVGEPPFVLASRNPNGAVTVAALGRTLALQGYFTPLADVTVAAGNPAVSFGIFGHYRSLTFTFDSPLGSVRVWGQDLAGEEAEDITGLVLVSGNRLTLPGDLITRVGRSSAEAGDISDPGMVMVIEKN